MTIYGLAAVAAIIAGTSAFIAYWCGYSNGRTESRLREYELRRELHELNDAYDDLEDRMFGRRDPRLTASERDMFRAIIEYNQRHQSQ
jgi:hypothetical protein